MSVESVIMQGRAFYEALMTSSCIVTRREGAPVLNEETGEYDTTTTVIYDGKCEIRFVSTVVSEQDYASQLVVEQDVLLSLPIVGSESVIVGDVAEITVNALDSGLVGRRFRVAGFHGQTYATARRFSAELVSA